MKEQNGNGFAPSIAQAIEEMKAFQGDSFSLERINLAEYSGRFYTPIPEIGNRRSDAKETALLF